MYQASLAFRTVFPESNRWVLLVDLYLQHGRRKNPVYVNMKVENTLLVAWPRDFKDIVEALL